MPTPTPPKELLDKLHDIHLPAIEGWWPPAPGWWLIVCVLLLLGFASVRLYLRYQRSLKVRALRALQQLTLSQQSPEQWLVSLSALLKRVAISRFGRVNVATLHGRAWTNFLNKHGKTDFFDQPQGQLLGNPLYQPAQSAQPDRKALLSAAKQWIKSAC
jgi:hypothetical protein